MLVTFFIPLVFATTGGMGKAANIFYCQLADLLASKHGWTYSTTLSWVRCVLAFSLLRSAIMCIRGSRSVSSGPLLLQLRWAWLCVPLSCKIVELFFLILIFCWITDDDTFTYRWSYPWFVFLIVLMWSNKMKNCIWNFATELSPGAVAT